jgi:curli biogenesis system outer membrane secretion channel CsgG
MRKFMILLLVVGLCFSLVQTINAQNADQMTRIKKRVAVFAFEDKTDHQWHWWSGQPVGQGMADMLVTELVKSGKYRVIERQALEKVMEEQQLGMSGAVTPQSAAQVGQLLGVELAIIGSVTEFGYKKGNVGGRVQGFGLGVQSTSATVGIDIRFTNTTTGEIIAAENVRKEESKKGLALDTDKFSFENQNEFDESLVGKATRAAVEEIMKKIDTQMQSVAWQAKVISAKEGNVFINAGSESGVQVGDVFTVYAPGEELIDPDTGISLGSEETKIGEIGVVANNIGNGKASKCTIRSGSGFDKGQFVRIK